jgi:hypothetical protein
MAPPPEAPKQNGRKRDHDEMEGIVAHYSEEDKWKLIRRVMEGLKAAYRIETDQEQAVTLFENYMKMSDGRRRRHNESELRRLMWAWRILKKRHEKRAEREIAKEEWTPTRQTMGLEMDIEGRTRPRQEAAASAIAKEASAIMLPRQGLEGPKEELMGSPKHPEREIGRPKRAWRSEPKEAPKMEKENELRTPPRQGIKAPKEELMGSPTNPIDEWIISSGKRNEIAKDEQGTSKKTKKKKAVSTPPRKMKIRQKKHRKSKTKQGNNHQIGKIRAIPTERKVSEFETSAAMDDNNSNHYFWHRGRPPEAEDHQIVTEHHACLLTH